MIDRLKFAALVATFIAVLATFGLAVQWWDYTWKAAVEPTRMSIYSSYMSKLSPCLRSFWHWRENGCRLI